MKYRSMRAEEINRIGEVSRAETIYAEFATRRTASGMGLEVLRREISPPVHISPWSKEGLDKRIESWRPHLEQGGALYGAFLEDDLAGFILLGPTHDDLSAEIVALFVDAAHRRLGIAGRLMAWAEEEAKKRGAESLFLYANPKEIKLFLLLAAKGAIPRRSGAPFLAASRPGDCFNHAQVISTEISLNERGGPGGGQPEPQRRHAVV